MGMMEMCGALSGMMMIIGLQNSAGPDGEKLTKADTYRKVKEYVKKFQQKNGAYLCRELKGVETGCPLRSCNDCIADAAELVEQILFAEK